MAKKSILDQIESGERARLIPVASDQRDEFSGFRGSDEYRSLLAGAMHETRRDPNASSNASLTPMPPQCPYVDLNPIRAAMAQTPEESDYTSTQQRILEQQTPLTDAESEMAGELRDDLRAAIGKLMRFSDQRPEEPERVIPYEIRDYLDLVDWSGRAVVERKCGSIPDRLPPILKRLKIDPEQYIRFISKTGKARFRHFIGPVEAMRDLADRFGRTFLEGPDGGRTAFQPGLKRLS